MCVCARVCVCAGGGGLRGRGNMTWEGASNTPGLPCRDGRGGGVHRGKRGGGGGYGRRQSSDLRTEEWEE